MRIYSRFSDCHGEQFQQRNMMTSVTSDEVNSTEDLESFEFVPHPGPSNYPHSSELTNSSEAVKDKPRLKSRLVSAWNSVKYGGWTLKTKPRLSKNSSVCMLGHTYHLGHEDERQLFRCVFSSLFWMTYRRGFSSLHGSSLTSDSGWGCTLRSAQMLLAQALVLHTMPSDWIWPGTQQKTRDDLELRTSRPLVLGLGRSQKGGQRRRSEGAILDEVEHGQEIGHRRLVAWFGDTPSAPFGLHRLVELGQSSGQRAGDWYGPSVAAHMLRKAVESSEVSDLAVYVAQDCTVYVTDVMRVCKKHQDELMVRFRSVIILVPVRLGGDTLNPAYIPYVKRLLQLKCCVGIIGGKPKHSLYFVGFQDDQLLYLDPHFCQAAVDVSQPNFPLESFHCKTARKLPFHRMDPSCTLGFYAKSKRDFDTLRSEVTTTLTSSTDTYPIFTFVEGSGQDQHEQLELTFDPGVPVLPRDQGRRRSKRSSMDEFVLL
ncbi:cysteine protease atg4da isoform 2-T2 [Clarias gariepinus]|uniref:cysteine protease atg4da-like isoform X2 n=1 Tax=Clarias gariepinus TaxID=13013 RepID=UPI00234DAE37|nr:cysteine protease atg4da-like isoform X2 [Clarias gariepinus]